MKKKIVKLKQIIWVGEQELIALFKEPRLYVILACVFLFLKKQYSHELNALERMQLTMGIWEICPYIETDILRSFIIKIGFIGIISDIPREGNRMVSYLLRTGKRIFLRSQQLYIVIMAIFYTFFIQICCVAYHIPYLENKTRWSVFTTQYITRELNHPSRISFQTQPLEMHLLTTMLFACALMMIGLIILFFNMCINRKAGCIAASCLIAFDTVVQWIQIPVERFPVLHWFSPLAWCRLSGINLGYNQELPAMNYIIFMIACLCILLNVGMCAILRGYDFQKGGN